MNLYTDDNQEVLKSVPRLEALSQRIAAIGGGLDMLKQALGIVETPPVNWQKFATPGSTPDTVPTPARVEQLASIPLLDEHRQKVQEALKSGAGVVEEKEEAEKTATITSMEEYRARAALNEVFEEQKQPEELGYDQEAAA
jgi:hypothetical protein